ncbi:uncharacterized protein RCC_12087 [Ramularia collo-cygni]|uniref:Zn(2)-C6 fungal-type domain-containing protein n=1 Tax=Ramularia collo-cygni TaxID=112498 RepID=A0A2D3V821_9PEZI|nr:uncharacterized protein RCC_12087 [Ramularia collo-cygni]CZT16503.1 uncharacterized protein RCC_12087 [Ramularia collo-cygni]
MNQGPKVNRAGQRLRSACTECHAAKVKCTAESTGCARCLQSGFECNYEVSMVGKCRRRKRTTSSDITTRPVPRSSFSTARSSSVAESPSEYLQQQSTAPTSPLMTGSRDGSTSMSINDNVFDWSSDGAPSNPFDAEFVNDSAPNAITSNDNDISVGYEDLINDHLGVDFSIPHIVLENQASNASSSSGPSTTTLPWTIDPDLMTYRGQASLLRQDLGNDTSSSMGVCYAAIARLDALCRQSNPQIDMVVGAVKTSAKDIAQLMQLTSYRRSYTGPSVVLVAVEPMVNLFEMIAPRVTGQYDQSSLASMTEPRLPSLMLGNFKAEGEEATSIWKQIVLAEAHRLSRLIDMLSDQINSAQAQPRGWRATGFSSSCHELEQRVRALVIGLERPAVC